MGKLTIQEIAKILVEKNKLTIKDANQFASMIFEVIQQGLEEDGQVKIKGFGTFKMIQVEARESVSVRTGERVTIDSHAKVTFTPDAVMKELVNKPFSQFETVILNDGVEFEDISDDLTEEELAELESMESSVDEDVAPVDDKPASVVEASTAITEKPQVIAEEPKSEVKPLMEFVDETLDQEAVEEQEEDEDEQYEENSTSRKKTFGYILLTILLMAASAYAGYWYGQKTAVAVDDTPSNNVEVLPVDSIEEIVVDTVVAVDNQVDDAEQPNSDILIEQPKSDVQTEQTNPHPKVEPEKSKQTEEPFWKKYEAMDARVRTGAYHIVGTDHEVKVRAGETLSRIARRELGEGMSCYIEVYNGLNVKSELKEGQTIKIPKLKWKKKRSID